MKDLIKITEINSLVISGGAVKGLLSIGAIKFLFEYEIIKKIKYFYGTSSGGLIATILVLGWSLDDILKFMTKFPIDCVMKYDVNVLAENYGLVSRENNEILYKKIIQYKNHNVDITFKELYEKTSVELNLITFSLKQNSGYQLNHINTPNLKVWEGLYMTSALPILFPPYEYNDDIFIDGGIVENFPINRVKPENRDKMIGIYIDTCYNGWNIIKNNIMNKNLLNSIEYSIELIKIFFYTSNHNHSLDLCIKLNTDEINSVNFKLDQKDREKLISLGYSQTSKQFQQIIKSLFNKQINDYKLNSNFKSRFNEI